MVRMLTVLALTAGLGLAAHACLAQDEGVDLKAAYIFNFARRKMTTGGSLTAPASPRQAPRANPQEGAD